MGTLTEVYAHRADADKSLLATGVPHQEPTIESPVLVRDLDTGEPVVYVARYPGDLAKLRRAMLAYPMSQTGTVRSGGIRNRSSVFGYVGRRVVLKREQCRSCLQALQSPAQHRVIAGAATELARHFAEVLPERAAHDLEAANAVLPDWRLDPQAPWTSGVVNWLSPLPYHYDGNNLDAWSAMPVIRRGVRGGHLHIPEYGLVIACRDGDTVFFAGYDLMHGVTPLRRQDSDGYRMSAVYYAVRDLTYCLPPDQEFQQGQKNRVQREEGLLARQRSAGLLRDEVG